MTMMICSNPLSKLVGFFRRKYLQVFQRKFVSILELRNSTEVMNPYHDEHSYFKATHPLMGMHLYFCPISRYDYFLQENTNVPAEILMQLDLVLELNGLKSSGRGIDLANEQIDTFSDTDDPTKLHVFLKFAFC